MQTKHSFKYWQWRVIICSMIGYAMFYFVRKNFSFAIPLLNEEYGISNASFGIIMTLGGLIYGVSKFVNGILADRTNPRWHLAIGLTICVLTSFLFGFADKISNRDLIRRLQLGEETPIRLSFTQAIRTREQLAAHMGKRLLLDSTEIIMRLNDREYMAHFGLTPETAVCLFIPNTYEVYWTMSADQLFARMYKEYNRFWNEQRLAKAKKLGLTPVEVATIASIIASETNKTDEYPTIASIYLNRLRKGIALQACPTVIFATGDFSLRRVLKRHLAIDSPYNTYKYRGLPPGPIRLARPDVIDAVLNAPKTTYLYMCANPDFSGTHVFSSSYAEHSAVARQYQRALNQRKVK